MAPKPSSAGVGGGLAAISPPGCPWSPQWKVRGPSGGSGGSKTPWPVPGCRAGAGPRGLPHLEMNWHVSSPVQTFRRSWGQRADRSPFILSLLLCVWASLAAWYPGGHRENPQQEKPWSPQGHCSPSIPSHAGPVAGDTHPLSPGSLGVLVPCTRPHNHMHTAKHSPQQSPWRLSGCPPL